MSKDKFFNLPRRIQEVPGLNGLGPLYVRELSGAEAEEIARAVRAAETANKNPLQFARYILYCACDENGNRVFNNGDFQKVCDIPQTVAMEIARAAFKVNNEPEADEPAKN